MKNSLIALALVGAAAAHPTAFMSKREVPQEHAHENILRAVDTLLQKNNPDNIKGSVFALLGAKAAAEGAGNIKDTDCLQQAVADQAFTNAKADNDVEGMTNALIFRALERNTGSVGLASAACTSIKAVNPEIAALQQHQDPASDGAAALNKGIAQELTRQIAAIGGDTSLGNEASTFAPGKIGDPTGAGNTCDDANDAKGCINTQGLRVDDLSAAEITAAASGAAGNGAAANSNAAATNDNAASNGNASNQNASNRNQKASNQNASAAENNAASGAADNAATGNAAGNAATAATGAATGAGAFGNCDPTIKFGTPSDGRKEDAFEPADLATFNHGSALNIAVISNFICSQVGNKCKVDAAAVSTCNDAATAANGLKGQAAADAFNSALGL